MTCAYYIGIIALIFIPLNCIFDSPEEERRIYQMVTFNDGPAEEWSSDQNSPLEIELVRFPPIDRYRGRVRVMREGWLPIDDETSGGSGFEVPGKGKLGRSPENDKIIFLDLEMNEWEMRGIWHFYCPRCFFVYYRFQAIRKSD